MISVDNLISNPIARAARHQQKEEDVLRFLRQHLWSTQNILQEVMRLQTRQAAHKALSKMQDSGLVRSHKFFALGGSVTLWGITAHGQAMAFQPENESPFSDYFEPSRVSEQNIHHHLDLQKLRIIAEANNWTGWIDGDRLGLIDKSSKRPDALVKDCKGNNLAIECERTFKTIKRYEQILLSYLKLLKAEKISKVIWVLPTHDMAERLKKLITGIKFVNVAGQRVQIDPVKHHANLIFCSYEQWPEICVNKSGE